MVTGGAGFIGSHIVDGLIARGHSCACSTVWSTLGNMDVIVVPSLWYEASPLVVQGAFAAGVPVVASDIGGLREKTLEGGGMVFPPGDAATLQGISQ